jgi:carbonic anhydrase
MTDDIYKKVFENNKRWVAEKVAERHDYFERLAATQTPDFFYIGCADSRVPANEIMGLEPGDVFVHRNVANLVCNIDMNVQSALQYAVEVLNVKHIVVCGHYGCGGVAAAMKAQDLGFMNGWLREVRDIYRSHQPELDAIKDENLRFRRLVELNVQEQCINVIKTSWVQRRWLRDRQPEVHAWVYDLKNGLLVDLEVPFVEILEKIQQIYRLEPG